MARLVRATHGGNRAWTVSNSPPPPVMARLVRATYGGNRASAVRSDQTDPDVAALARENRFPKARLLAQPAALR